MTLRHLLNLTDFKREELYLPFVSEGMLKLLHRVRKLYSTVPAQ